MAYTTINKSTAHFNSKIYTGTGSTNAQTNVGFQPDLLWNKSRTTADNHLLYDAIRGITKTVSPDLNSAESTRDSAFLTSIDSDGFTVGSNGNINASGQSFVMWNWKANGAGSANTSGSINSTVSVNQSAGFSIVKWTGTQSLGTVAHGLNATPDVILIKNVSASENWIMYHVGLGGNTKNLYLDATNAVDTRTDTFNSTSPTSSLFTVNTATGTNKSGSTMMAYCFAGKTGYSKFGSYTGNGNADGTFVYTGFKPAFVITKNSSISDWWGMFDNKRLGYNSSDSPRILFPNTNDVESNSKILDFTSNGFKIRSSNGAVNGSGNTVIYMAFGQSLVGSNNVPCTAR